jgi:hypothetical protein
MNADFFELGPMIGICGNLRYLRLKWIGRVGTLIGGQASKVIKHGGRE